MTLGKLLDNNAQLFICINFLNLSLVVRKYILHQFQVVSY